MWNKYMIGSTKWYPFVASSLAIPCVIFITASLWDFKNAGRGNTVISESLGDASHDYIISLLAKA